MVSIPATPSLIYMLPITEMLRWRQASYDAYRIARAAPKTAEKLRKKYPDGAELVPYLQPLLDVHCLEGARSEAVQKFLNDNRQRFALPPEGAEYENLNR